MSNARANPWQPGMTSQLTATAPPFKPPPPFASEQGRANPMNMSTSSAGYGGNSTSNAPSNNVTPSVHSSPVGTVKYKGELCRSWEVHGSCPYKNCTFAHGLDDIRLQNGAVPNAALFGNGNGSNKNTPVQRTYSLTAAGSSPPLPAASVMGPSPVSIASAAAETEKLVELIVLEIRRERDMLLQLQETNRNLERELKQEQLARQRDINDAHELELMVAALEEEVRGRNALMSEIRSLQGGYDMETVVAGVIDDDDDD